MHYAGFPDKNCPVRNILNLARLTPHTEMTLKSMNMQVVKWCVDIAMGIAFLFSAVTGSIKFLILMRVAGFTDLILPVALMSEAHDRAGIVLSILVLVHLILNRAWILSMTRRILSGKAGTG